MILSLKVNLKDSYYQFEISKDRIDDMKSLGILKISKILEKRNLTDFEETIILGIHWFANSQNQTEIENQFLSLMIALEIFLTPNDNEPISNSIAEGASIILFSDLKDRKELKKTIKGFYTKRSSIVHGRKDKLPKKEDVSVLKSITADLIRWMAENSDDFNQKKDLLNYLEDLRLT